MESGSNEAVPEVSDPNYWKKMALLTEQQVEGVLEQYEAVCRLVDTAVSNYLDGKLELRGREVLEELRNYVRGKHERVANYKEQLKQVQNGNPNEPG